MSPGSDLSRIPPETLASSAMMPPHLRDDPVSTLIMVSTIQAYRLPVTFMNLGETYTVPQKDGNVRPGLMSKLQRT
ncbi:MAG TPA: hypothetical protein VLL25_04025, partial [Acidimicrobiales bacterium]|nr:hypothetical protein [Acidimicrobiales bacterium]